MHLLLRVFVASTVFRLTVGDDVMPPPFVRVLEYTEGSSLQSGSDVVIAQSLLIRSPAVESLDADGYFGEASASAVSSFQAASSLSATGVFDSPTASALLECCERDNYVDEGKPASFYGKLYKIIVPVKSNRSLETSATLLDKDNNVIRNFTVRTHGNRGDGTSSDWPDYGDGDVGLNELTSNGNTPTGLSTIDLNSPEPEDSEKYYGPYPINRVVDGLEGNMGLLLSTDSEAAIRSGILVHTGEWPDWDSSEAMPNSDGCLHGHPEDVEGVWNSLVDLGVEVHENPFSSIDYPYETQGIISVFLESE